ncbi:DUF819 family protein [Gemmatimonadota bacterium]
MKHYIQSEEVRMFWSLVLALLFLLFPALAIYGERRSKVLAWLSPVVLCYAFGIMLANFRIIPVNEVLAVKFTTATVVLAIPMLLFSMDFRRWLRLARKTILSFFLAIIAVMSVSTIAVFLFQNRMENSWQAAGMLVGVYTGGTPNMTAIGIALEVPNEMFILLNAADVALSSLYLILLMTVAQRLLLRVLPAFKPAGDPDTVQSGESHPDKAESGKTAIGPVQVLAAAGLSAVAGAIAVGFSMLLVGKVEELIVILSITTLGIAGSFIRPVRERIGMYETGQYLLLIFCVAIGAIANIQALLGAFGSVFGYTAFVLVGAIVLHYALAIIFRIDADTAIITSTAAVFGPAFVGPIGNVLKNREIVVSGLTTGVIGYAVGNFLGLGLAQLLKP